MKFNDSVLARATFPSVLDSTILLTSACPTKFFYKHCFHLAPQQKSIHLHAGGAFAEAMQVVRTKFYKEKLGLEKSLLEGMRAFILYWGDYEAPEGSYKNFENMLAAVFDYFHVYNPEDDFLQPFVQENGDPAVEFTFSIPLPIPHPDTGEPLIYAGRCDMIGVYNNLLAIDDEKTCYSFGFDWSRVFQMRGQFIGYTWAAQQYNMPVNLCIVRGIAIQQRNIKHLETMFTFPQWQIDRWYKEMLQKVTYLSTCWSMKEFPMNYGDICGSYGGCEMMDLCTSKDPEVWFPTFDIREWNPLHKGIIHTDN